MDRGTHLTFFTAENFSETMCFKKLKQKKKIWWRKTHFWSKQIQSHQRQMSVPSRFPHTYCYFTWNSSEAEVKLQWCLKVCEPFRIFYISAKIWPQISSDFHTHPKSRWRESCQTHDTKIVSGHLCIEENDPIWHTLYCHRCIKART